MGARCALAALVVSGGISIVSGSSEGSSEQKCYGPVKVGADIVGFVLITTATLYIGFKNATYRGPSNTERNFNGYKEENMIALFINLFASVAYWARIISNATCTHGFVMLTHLRYCDYLTTCPLLVLDLLWNLEAPYKCTSGGLILITILTGVACSMLPSPQSYLWFAFGDVIFFFVYWMIFTIVRERVAFFVARAKNEMAIKAMYYIKFACACFFLIWIWFPLLWIVSPYCLKLIDIEVLDLCHMFLDVVAKSVYGVVLLWFRWHYDKKLLRNIDDEEFYQFSAKCPDRKAIMQIIVGDEEEAGEDGHGHSPKSKHADSAHGHEGKGPHGVGSRLLFASNRRQIQPAGGGSPSEHRHSGPGQGPGQFTIRVGGDSHTPLSPRSPRSPHYPHIQERWLHDLGAYLEGCGVADHATVSDVLSRLDQSGLIEEQLRTCVSEEDLQELGIDVVASRAILGHYASLSVNPAAPPHHPLAASFPMTAPPPPAASLPHSPTMSSRPWVDPSAAATVNSWSPRILS